MCCNGLLPDNSIRTLMSGCLRWKASTTRRRASASSGLAAKKNVSASSSELHPVVHADTAAAPSAPAPTKSVRRSNCLVRLVFVVHLRRHWQRENRAVQAIGIADDVDAVYPAAFNADLQQRLNAARGRDRNAGDSVDEDHDPGPCARREPSGFLGDLLGA